MNTRDTDNQSPWVSKDGWVDYPPSKDGWVSCPKPKIEDGICGSVSTKHPWES